MKTREFFGLLFVKDKCRNRYKTYKKWYRYLKAIMNQSGFGWDPSKATVTVEPLVWEDTIKVSV